MVAIPGVVVFSTLCSTALHLDPAAQISFSQRLLIITGLMTLLQSLFGHRYPILEGPSSAVLLSFIVLAPYGLSAIEGGLICGGLLLIAVSLLRWFKWLSPFFNQNVVGMILMLVALTLLTFVSPLLIGMNSAHPLGGFKHFWSFPLDHFLRFSCVSLAGGISSDNFHAGRNPLWIIPFPFAGKDLLSPGDGIELVCLPLASLGGWPTFSLPPS